jgi:hypothetical protein
MGTVKITQIKANDFTIEDEDGEIHTGLSMVDAVEHLGIQPDDLLKEIEAGKGGVAYIDFDEPEEDGFIMDGVEEEDEEEVVDRGPRTPDAA